jgi:hypothetical protein
VTNYSGSITSAPAVLTVTNPPTLQALGVTPQGFGFQLPVPTGRTYVILASTDSRNWTPIYTNVSLTGNVTFTDTNMTGFAQRFYRTVIQ